MKGKSVYLPVGVLVLLPNPKPELCCWLALLEPKEKAPPPPKPDMIAVLVYYEEDTVAVKPIETRVV